MKEALRDLEAPTNVECRNKDGKNRMTAVMYLFQSPEQFYQKTRGLTDLAFILVLNFM